MEIEVLRAFEDNYIWLLREDRSVAVVDPGDAVPVLRHLEANGLRLSAILITHHHGDHTGGVAGLVMRYPVPVFGPAGEAIPCITTPLQEGDNVTLPGFQARLNVLAVPGHTRGHIAYHGEGAVFCGDTLFACGCGRLFEGSAEQMWGSLGKLAALPGSTQVYCAHEYTEANIRFALAVEPENTALLSRRDRVGKLRADGLPSVPFPLSEEWATNPFLRSAETEVAKSASRHCNRPLDRPVDVFAALREWKNVFR